MTIDKVVREMFQKMFKDSLLELEQGTPHGLSNKEYSLKAEGARLMFNKTMNLFQEIGIENDSYLN